MVTARIGIVGGSLGGLTAGCLLRDAGHDVTVFERSSSELEERGAGIGFLEPTYRYLASQAAADVREISIETGNIRYLNRDGSVAHSDEHSYLFSSWNAVYRKMLERFDSDRYLLGHECVDFSTSASSAEVAFANGARFEGDLVVAADGIGSLFRSRLLPGTAPSYAGYVAWRGMVPETVLPDELTNRLGDAITYYVYANSHILVYPIPGVDGSTEPGERLVNFVWYRNYSDGGDLDDLMTDNSGRLREMSIPPGAVASHHVAEMKAQAAGRLLRLLASLVDATEHPFVQVIYDIEVDKLVFDRICLLGDAALQFALTRPPGRPAADDAWVLAAALDAHDSVDDALATFEPSQVRLGHDLLERTRRIGYRSQVENSWKPGDPEFIFGLYRAGE